MSTVEQDGGIHVEGEYVGHIKGFHFIPDGSVGVANERTLKAASLKAVAQEIQARAQAVAAAPDPDFSLTKDGLIIWQSAPIARLEAGAEILKPRISLIAGDQLNGADREAVQFRLERWTQRHVASLLEPLINMQDDEQIAGLARGFSYRLVESLGILSREEVVEDVKSLSQEQRAGLRKHGVRFGAFHVFVPALLKPAPTTLRLLLWALSLEKNQQFDRARLAEPPGQGLTSVPFDRTTPHGYYRVVGFRVCGPRAVRIDMLERLGDLIRERVFWKPRFEGESRPAGSIEGGGFAIVPDMMSMVGCSGEEFSAILRSLGFRMMRRPADPAPPPAVEKQPNEPSSAAPAPAPAPAEPEHTARSETQAADAQNPESASVKAALNQSSAVLEVWWPKDTGPFRRQHRHRRNKEESRQKVSVSPLQAKEHRKPPKRAPRQARPPAPTINPDSPFAVLGSLRSQLVDKKNV